ncbi:MAG: ABC transporter permease [Anaerolineae bacterium]
MKEIFRYRELVRNLVIRDLKVRYRNSLLGFLWAWGNPVMMTLVFTVVFSILRQTTISRFPLFILIAWLVWSFTQGAILEGTGTIVHNSNLVKKVYFPRETLPISSVLANAANFLFALPLIIALVFYYQVEIQPTVLFYFPIIFIAHVALIMGITLFLSAVNVLYRDTGVITGVVMTAWFFLTPVFYPVKDLTGVWNGIDLGRVAYYVNPMASIIESYRNVLYGTTDGGQPSQPDFEFLLRTVVTSFVILLIGYFVFARLSRRFGEEL